MLARLFILRPIRRKGACRSLDPFVNRPPTWIVAPLARSGGREQVCALSLTHTRATSQVRAQRERSRYRDVIFINLGYLCKSLVSPTTDEKQGEESNDYDDEDATDRATCNHSSRSAEVEV